MGRDSKFRRRLDYYCRRRRYKHKDLAGKLNVENSTFSKWVNGGNPWPSDALTRVCEILNLDTNETREMFDLARELFAQSAKEEDRSPLNKPPPPNKVFFGRDDEIDRVLEGLATNHSMVVIEAVEGGGKTSFVVEAVKRLREDGLEKPFEKVVWIRPETQPNRKDWLEEVLNAVARELLYRDLARDLHEGKPQKMIDLLGTRRTLIIIDSFHLIDDLDLDDWLQRVRPPSAVLITNTPKKPQPKFVDNAWFVDLPGLKGTPGLAFMRYHAANQNLRRPELADDTVLKELVEQMAGHPQAMQYAVYLAKTTGIDLRSAVEHVRRKGIDWESRWDTLEDPTAQKVLIVMSFFPDTVSREALSATTEYDEGRLYQALEQLVPMFFIRVHEMQGGEVRYSLHALARAFAEHKLKGVPEVEAQARRRWIQFYLDFAQHSLGRGKLRYRYWNSLGIVGLAPVDIEWPNLQKVLDWSIETGGDDARQMLVGLMVLLVHYMDKRALFRQRIEYVQKAVEAADHLSQRAQTREETWLCKVDEAWLLIDGLGWALMEEGRLPEAESAIRRGKEVAESVQKMGGDFDVESGMKQVADNQIALADTFLARTFLKREDTKTANSLISKILPAIDNYWPMTQTRIYMIGGDIAYAEKEYTKAIMLYEKENRISQEFEEENSYRLGSAYLDRRAEGDVDRAEEVFKKVLQALLPDSTIEVMNAYWGLAQIAEQRGRISDACAFARTAYDWLFPLTPKHELSKKIKPFLEKHCGFTG